MTETRKIVVVGSLNMDLVARVARLPRPGETVRGHDFTTAPGGKGANQAVAAGRLASGDTRVAMIGHVGEDTFAAPLRQSLEESGVDTTHVSTVSGPTGTAMISVEESGENVIIISAGANGTWTPADMDAVAPVLQSADALLLQFEVPMPVVERAAEIAASAGVQVILNPAPAPDHRLPDSLLRNVSLLIPNETEAATLAGTTDVREAAERLLGLGVTTVVVTLGEQGVLLAREGEENEPVPTFSVAAVDTTAAGDAFVGALAVALVEGQPLRSALRFACGAGALAATKHGAQPSLPQRDDLEQFLAKHGDD
jgi:ribokinase